MLFSPNYVKVSGMDFGKFLSNQARIVDKRLEEVLKKVSKKMGGACPELEKLFNEFINSTRNGKRIRGALVLLGYQIGGGKAIGKVLDAAVAFEVFQTAILAQDDIVDKSLTRRSKDSLYAALGGDHRAISQTIYLSDIGFFIAIRLLSGLRIENEKKLNAIRLFLKTLEQTVIGQMLDTEIPFLQGDFLERDVIKIGLLKTAPYTISGPLLLGATLAGAEPKLLKQLQVFGDNLGMAFQIQDDILGIFGEEKIIGKSVDSDIKERKATILIAIAQKKGSKEQKKVLEEYYGNQDIDSEGINLIKKVFIETGALAYANLQAEKYFQKSRESLKASGQELLYSLIDFLEKRVK